jgi:AraC family L-rhamnose operon regulatory protein RhaS
MKRYYQYQPLMISDFLAGHWPHPEHKHNHYELIYIKAGTGMHVIQQIPHAYQTGAVFLLGPEDEHYFEIAKPTHFIYVKFTDPHAYKTIGGIHPYVQKLEYLIKSRQTHLSGFQLNLKDQHTAAQIFSVIAGLKDDVLHNEQIIWMQVLTLAVILQRNMPELSPTAERSRDMQAVFCYLHKYIYTPEKLKAAVLAAHFNTTTDYIGPYFKRNTGVTLRDYIKQYRKILISQRVASGQYSLKEIASEFGLTDESHVSKIMKSL